LGPNKVIQFTQNELGLGSLDMVAFSSAKFDQIDNAQEADYATQL